MDEGNGKKRKLHGGKGDAESDGGAIGPGGEFVDFPEYEGDQEPRENRKAFTFFCKATRKEVKGSLNPPSRNNRDQVNGILKDRWHALTDDGKQVWKEWEAWDTKRYSYQLELYEQKMKPQSRVKKKAKIDSPPDPTLREHHERQWNGMFDKLVEYKRVKGDTKVPERYKDDPKLGKWISAQRQQMKLGKVPGHRVAKLDSLGFVWRIVKSGSELWSGYIEKLKRYREEHGDCLVPCNHPELGTWASNLRVSRKAGKLKAERERELEELGFAWHAGRARKDAQEDRRWQEQFIKLKRYKEVHGDCLVPYLYEEDCPLSYWVVGQRSDFKKGTLRQDRIDKLNEIGFAWVPKKKIKQAIYDSRWMRMYEELRNYKEEHGHCLPPPGINLHYWVKAQRHRRYGSEKNVFRKRPISQEEINRLDEIGFTWKPKWADNCWKGMYKRLKRYKFTHGHCCVPREFDEDRSLGAWVCTQRILKKKGDILPNRKEKLDKIGFVWSVIECKEDRDETKHDEQWKTQYEKLCLFHDEHGHCLVPTCSNLIGWVQRQRHLFAKNQLKSDRKDLLEEIGFVWAVDHYDTEKSMVARRWEAMYNEMVQFRNETGHCKIRFDHENQTLYAWATSQRRLFLENRLHAYRKAKLDEIDFFLGLSPDKIDSLGG